MEVKSVRRYLLVFLMAIFSGTLSFGQAAILVLIFGDKLASENLYLSIDGAMNVSTLPGLDEYKTSIGVNYGLGVHIRLNDKWFLKPEFKPLSRKGARKTNPITPVSGDFIIEETKIKLNYMDFPVFIEYNISPKMYVSAGPQISFVTDVKQYMKGTKEDNGMETSVKVNTTSFFNKTNFSFPVEAGYKLTLGNEKSTTKIHVNVFARYEYSFIEIFKDPAVGSSKVSLFQFGLSLPFIKEAD